MDFQDLSRSEALLIAANQNRTEREYWLNQLSGEPEESQFPPDFKTKKDGKENSISSKEVKFTLPNDLSTRTLKVAKYSHQALNTILVTVLTILLHKYTGNTDILLGSPIYRQHKEEEFINTILVLRTRLSPTMTFKETLLKVKETIIEADKHQNYPFEILRKQLIPRDFPGPPHEFHLFHTAVLLENIHEKTYLQENNKPICPLIFLFHRNEEKIEGCAEYDPAIYRESTIKQITRHFTALLKHAVFNPDLQIPDIDILSEEEKKQILADFNDTAKEYPQDKTLHRLFEEQTARTPDGVSIVGSWQLAVGKKENVHFSYDELNERSGRLAHLLRGKGVLADNVVGIMVEPCVEMIVAILGILKAGGAYLPIDPDYPQERIDYMLKDSNAVFLLAEITKEDFFEKILLAAGHRPPATSLAYVIYTSGTTGRPRGVLVEHSQVVNTLVFRRDQYRMKPGDAALQLFSFAFDGFVTACFTPLISGALVVLPGKEDIRDMGKLRGIIVKHRVTHFIAVPPFYRLIIESLSAEDSRTLRMVTLAGDAVSSDMLAVTAQKNPGLEIVNEYGVTEAAVMSTINRHQESDPRISIGKPIANTRIYILDPWNRAQPIGVSGELVIGGAGVARGYLNQPELTAERFIESIFYRSYKSYRTYRNYIFYKTGDLARWLSDGSIEFLGRIDHQVKIRGYRVELSEVRDRLMTHPGVKEALVVVRGDETGDKYLCAYIAAPDKTMLASSIAEEFRNYLSRMLPSYMIPSYFVPIEKIPLNPNGKVDRKALPAPEISSAVYTPPGSEIENRLALIWSEILGLSGHRGPGIDDNFFLLGGHSIKITVMASKIEKAFNIKIPVVEIHKRPTIRQLAAYVQGLQKGMSLPDDEKLVLLRHGGDLHVFFIHDGTGEVDGYVEFCRHLDANPVCWGIRLQTGHFPGLKNPDIRIQELARQYIETIKKVQPVGPYYLAGWSVGGTIVFEMVRQMEESGEIVHFAALIDSPAPETYFTQQGLDRLSDEEIRQRSEAVGEPHVIRALHRARASYVPQSGINTPIHYFEAARSKEIDEMYKRMNINQWKKLTRGKMVRCEVPGDHYSIFRLPRVKEFSRVFEKALQSSIVGV